MLTSCYEISRSFTPDLPLPHGGFAASPAFDPASPLADRLRTEHETAMDGRYYGREDPPTFNDVLTRVNEHQALLAPGTGR